jgi:hypothetical protein
MARANRDVWQMSNRRRPYAMSGIAASQRTPMSRAIAFLAATGSFVVLTLIYV